MTWNKIEVYNYGSFLGSFYTTANTKTYINNEIDEKYGKGNWSKFNIGN